MGEVSQNTSSGLHSFQLFLGGGIAAYWAWLHLACFVPFGSFYAASATGAWSIMPIAGFIVTAAALFAGKYVSSCAHHPAICLFITCISTVGTALVIFDVSTVVGVVMMTIIGPLCTFSLIGIASECRRWSSSLPTCFYSAMILSFLIYVLGYALPWQASSVICISLPIISTVLLLNAVKASNVEQSPEKEGLADGLSPSANLDERAPRKNRHLPIPPMLVLYTAVFSLALNYLMVEISSVEAVSASPFELACIVQSAAIIAIAIGIELFFNKRDLSVIALFIAFVTTLVLLTWTITGASSIQLIMPLLIAGYFLFVCVSQLKAAQYASQGKKEDGAPAIIASICSNMLGLIAGSALGAQSVSASPAFPSALAITVCALMIISLFILPEKTTLSIASLAGMGTPKTPLVDDAPEENDSANEIEPPNEITLANVIREQSKQAAERYNLTPRETDILEYLLRGWELQSIAEKECLSRNTVKTHTAHIYQKLGVHTREECAMVIEQLCKD